MPEYIPKVNVAKELSEISKDFTHPRELIRETISNSIDASASIIKIEACEDDSIGENELVIRIIDNGVGMNQETLQGFFDLGYSNKRNHATAIGEKGHGTKITYNSNEIKVFSRYIESNSNNLLSATLNNPKRQLTLAVRQNNAPPKVVFDTVQSSGLQEFDEMDSGTYIELRGYDNNNFTAFAHGPLKDYIQWFTAWGSVGKSLGKSLPAPCKLFLKGIGSEVFVEIPYGHPFPDEIYDFRQLRGKDDRRPENYFVKRWLLDNIPIRNFPGKMIQIVFSVEGDSAKRESNEMLKKLGAPAANDNFLFKEYRYNVSDRYGIYFCKDFIPIERKNEVFTQTSEWTKWHAFVNCQEFHLTANRSSVENTPTKLLDAIKETALSSIEEYIFDSDEYSDFKEKLKIEEGRRKAEKQKKDFKRRLDQFRQKRRFMIGDGEKKFEFLEPRSEQGVLWLLAKVSHIFPEKFPWLEVIDLDQHFGYDLLVHKSNLITGVPEPAFVELKFDLRDSQDFNHPFEFLSTIVCWKTKIQQDKELVDIQKHKRTVKITQPNKENPYTRCFLTNQEGGTNIEIIILEKYLTELLNLRTI